MKRILFLFSLIIPSVAYAGDALNTVVPLWMQGFDSNGSGSIQSFVLDQSTDQLEFVFQCERADTITDLCYNYVSKCSGTPVAHQIDLEGVNLTTGNPDGTIKSSTNAKAAFTPSATTSEDGTIQCKTLTSSYTCTQGELLAIVIKPTGAPTATNCGNFGYNASWSNFGFGLPYAIQNNATVRTKVSGVPTVSYKSATRTYGWPITGQGQTGYSSSQEDGNVFTVPASWCSTFKLDAVDVYGATPSAGKDLTFRLYNGSASGDTTVLDSVTVDGDTLSANGSNKPIRAVFTSSTTLTCGNGYRIVVAPTAAASGWNLAYQTVQTSADFGAWPLGTGVYYTTRNAGSWTDTTTKRANMAIRLKDVTTSSGTIARQSLNGGFQ